MVAAAAGVRYAARDLAVPGKQTHFGRAGEYYAMSELLLRGWNVAVPVVDVGDDVFVIDDRDKTTYRVQVKSGSVDVDSGSSVSFTLSRAHLQEAQLIELFFMLVAREADRWRLFVVPREELFALHDRWVNAERSGRGRPRKSHQEASDALKLIVSFDPRPKAWDEYIDKYESWPAELPEISDGPGTRGAI